MVDEMVIFTIEETLCRLDIITQKEFEEDYFRFELYDYWVEHYEP